MSRLSFTEALDQALELLEQGHPLEYCVRQFPEYADELRPLLQVSDDLHRLAGAPLPVFQKAAIEPDWETLLANVPQDQPGLFKRFSISLAQFLAYLQQHPVQRYSSLAAAVLILLVLSWQGSEQSVPNSPLYPIKRAVEQVKMVAALNPTDQVELHIELARRRFDELRALTSQTRQVEQPLLHEALTETREAVTLAQQAGVEQEYYTELSQLLSEADASIDQIKDHVVDPAPSVIESAGATVDRLRDDLEAVGVAQAATATPTPIAPTATRTSTPTPTPTHTSVATPVPTSSDSDGVEVPVPARTPTSAPVKPTQVPAPTSEPVITVTSVPSTPVATTVPTPVPTPVSPVIPTPVPTRIPTAVPTLAPTEVPTPVPTEAPTPVPTVVPTQEPTPVPTAIPTQEPTPVPTQEPTQEPTAIPTQEPTPVPTQEPTQEPTAIPTQEPTPVPTQEPTAVPTQEPTPVPTQEPTLVPTQEPTPVPTQEPTPVPTAIPTPVPTQEPTPEPTQEPTAQPTLEPTPTNDPALPIPTVQITVTIVVPDPPPTTAPTDVPTEQPTQQPTAVPTVVPTIEPTAAPTSEPTAVPTEEPTPVPSETAAPAIITQSAPKSSSTYAALPSGTQGQVTSNQALRFHHAKLQLRKIADVKSKLVPNAPVQQPSSKKTADPSASTQVPNSEMPVKIEALLPPLKLDFSAPIEERLLNRRFLIKP